MEDSPIQCHGALQLTDFGVQLESIKFSTLTMESEKYICILQEEANGTKYVIIIDVDNPSQLVRRQATADAAIMHPREPILTLRSPFTSGGNKLQTFNIELLKKLKEYQTTEQVIFLKWISYNILAIITTKSVYHWAKEGESDPVKMFDILPKLGATQIINYRADSTLNWLCLIGLSRNGDLIAGSMQLYSVEKNLSQFMDGHVACFANYTVIGATRPSTFLVLANRTATTTQLKVIEIVKGDSENARLAQVTDISLDVNDFPVAIQISEKYEVIYMITKFGYVQLFDLRTSTLIYSVRVTSETIFVSAFQESTEGVIGVNRKGQVLSIRIDTQNIVSYIVNKLNNHELATSFAANLRASDSIATSSHSSPTLQKLATTAHTNSDYELIEETNKSGQFKEQARYLMEHKDQELWAYVLKETNEFRRCVIDQAIQTAITVSNFEELTGTIRAFMTANLPNELIELLEKVVIEGHEFAGDRNLQNLLILTAIKANRVRVMDYVNRLDNYDAVDIATITTRSGLFEESFTIFKKFEHYVSAIEVLIDHIGNMERAREFAERMNLPKVYSKLGKAQLDRQLVKEAIESFIKANDPEFYREVIPAAQNASVSEVLAKYLHMCRMQLGESIDSELISAYAISKTASGM